ncbi:MAG: hypothetical protein H7099_13775 [Gemmatimonadaceae bacterium]|nr:hypothetical protein [Gemmatimonadaceae bacterium]
MALASFSACDDDDATGADGSYARPQQFPAFQPLTGQLDRSKLTITSAVSVNLDQNIARLPLFRGTYNGARVWFVRTDVSDSATSVAAGINFAPRLANAGAPVCPPCVQTAQTTNAMLGDAAVQFAGTVDFAPMRVVTPGPTGFPTLAAQPGSVAGPGYSDLVRIGTGTIVWNAPIVATGNGPFDVSELHTNTLDRVMAIDTVAMTVDLQFIRAFAHGKDIFYLTFGSSGALSSTLERATFTPVMGTTPFPNDDQNPLGARSGIVTFTNGKRGEFSPDAQGLAHVILDNPAGNLSLSRPDILRSLARGGDAHNVLATFPTLRDARLRRLYSPMWDLMIAEWSADVVARGENFAQPDFNTILQLAARGLITNPGGAPLSSANFQVNCPVLGFADTAPVEDLAPRPTTR